MSDSEDGEQRRLEVFPPIHKIGRPGIWLRRQLMKGILGGNPVLLGIQRLRTPFLNVVMGGISFLGEEEFYTLLIPVVAWIYEARLGRLLALLMALAFYCTGFLKNTFCLPRPPCPPIVPLHRCQDWSLPSHHALLSVSIPWYIWFYLHLHHSAQLSPQLMTLIFISISLWSFLVMFSRMYLGVHSPADILTGGVLGCLLLASWLQVDVMVDHFISSSGSSGVLMFASVAMVLLYLHPDPPPATIIYGETVALVGVAGGVVLARSLGPPSLMTAILEVPTSGSVWWVVCCSVLRVVLGLGLLVAVKEVGKAAMVEMLGQVCRLAGIPSVCVKTVSQVTYLKAHYSNHFVTLDKPPSEQASQRPSKWSTEQPLNLHLPVRILAYVSMGLVVVLLAPFLFNLLAI